MRRASREGRDFCGSLEDSRHQRKVLEAERFFTS